VYRCPVDGRRDFAGIFQGFPRNEGDIISQPSQKKYKLNLKFSFEDISL
jgi:hypothetical protein